MNKSRFALLVLLAVSVLVITVVSSSHAIPMRITEGTITSSSGSESIKGNLDWWGPHNNGIPSAYLFSAGYADIYFDSPSIDPILTNTFVQELEVQWVYEDHFDFEGFNCCYTDACKTSTIIPC